MPRASLDLVRPYLAPIADLLADPDVTEIMVNDGGAHVYVERGGVVAPVEGRAIATAALLVAIGNIARACGETVSEAAPILDARLADGSRVAALLPPCAVDGPTLTIRRFGRRFSLAELIGVGCLALGQATTLCRALVDGRNVLISGGTNTGKTTLANALVNELPSTDRFVVIEETAELRIDQPNLVRFEARRAEAAEDAAVPRPAVTVTELVRLALRYRPDRIILGEVRGAEAADLLQAWNTGHGGSLSTIHADSAARARRRLRSLVMRSGANLTAEMVDADIADAVQVVVHLARIAGRRQVVEVQEPGLIAPPAPWVPEW